MLDDLNELRTPQQVLTHGSLTAAARTLGVSLAVVSKRLATLEKRAGVAADIRTGQLEHVLPDWHAGDRPIVALFPDPLTIPRKTRIFLDAMPAATTKG